MNPTQLEPALRVATELRLIKGLPDADPELVMLQAEKSAECMESIDYHDRPGTCGDERARIGYLDGSDGSEARPSVFGGPGIYGLAIAEMTGQIEKSVISGLDALRDIDQKLSAAGIRNGGHVGCAAAALPGWMDILVRNPDTVSEYVAQELGEDYDPAIMQAVLNNTRKALNSGRYQDWDGETALQNVLGSKAGRSIELLIDAPHQGYMVIKQMNPGKTINRTKLYEESVLGKGAFVVDYAYADEIEAAVCGTAGAEAIIISRHAREAMHAAVASAVPNPELYQAIIRSDK